DGRRAGQVGRVAEVGAGGVRVAVGGRPRQRALRAARPRPRRPIVGARVAAGGEPAGARPRRRRLPDAGRDPASGRSGHAGRPGPAARGGFAGEVVVVSRLTGMPQPAPQGPRRGPLWFQKMDTNRDGDLSRREFLGTDEDFRRIDTDGDGLISVEEAERYDKAE